MTERIHNPVSPLVVAAGFGAAMAGVWVVGRNLGASLAENPAVVGRRRTVVGPSLGARASLNAAPSSPKDPAAQAWGEARRYVVPHVVPVERQVLPHQCDQLQPTTWGRGRICVAAGDVFLSVSPSSQHHVKKPGPIEVTFSENLQHYTVGDAWDRGVLGRWLSEQTPSQEPTGPALLALRAAGWPLATAQQLGGIVGGAQTLREFAQTHYVKTPVGSIRIIDLPATPATDSFREQIATHIAKAST